MKGVVVYNPTYANHPTLMKHRRWTPEIIHEYAQTKRQIKDNFVKAFKGFLGCEEINVYCRPSEDELIELFDVDLTDFVRSDDSKTKLILFAYAGHGGTFNGTTYALLDTATDNAFPLENNLALLGKRKDVYILSALNCCRTPVKVDGGDSST